MKKAQWSISKKKFLNCSKDYVDAMKDVVDEIKNLKENDLKEWVKENNADFKIVK